MLRFVQKQQPKEEAIAAIAKAHDIPMLLAAALALRGVQSAQDVQEFLHPSIRHLHDPFLLPDMHAAVSRIQRALVNGERICIYGDYDADGICATAMLMQYLQACHANVMFYIPSRHAEGYGLHEEALYKLHAQGVQLLITVDTGISACAELALCKTLGMDAIVTDHHQCPKELPVCDAVINPHREDSMYPYRDLCGTGVALKLVHALGGMHACESYLGIAALATVADVVPLMGENRIIVALGASKAEENIGLSCLLEVSGNIGQPVTSETLAFRLAPRLNAAGRMGDPVQALELLLAKEKQTAMRIALELNDWNIKRQAEEQAILREARWMLRETNIASLRAILLCASHWNPGVLGIVAARLREEYYRPVLLFCQEGDQLKGSCRSIPGVHLYHCLQPFDEYFLRFGGHAQAAGITMEATRFVAFQTAFERHLRETIPAEVFFPTQFYEQEIQLSMLSHENVDILQALAPYGTDNPEPVFLARNISLLSVEPMGKAHTHLRFNAAQGKTRLPVVAFGYGHRFAELQHDNRYDMLFTPCFNEWLGVKRMQLHMRAICEEQVLGEESALDSLTNDFYNAFFVNYLYNNTKGLAPVGHAPDLSGTNDRRILQALCEDCAGLLVLCHTPQGAKRLSTLLRTHEMTNHVQVFMHALPEQAMAYHTVLLAPMIRELNANAFETIIAYDMSFATDKNMQPDVEGDATMTRAFLLPLRMDRECFGRLYSAFVSIVKHAPQQRAQLMEACAQVMGYPAAVLVLAVCIELGFFRHEPQEDMIHAVESCERRELWQSKLYAAANVAINE